MHGLCLECHRELEKELAVADRYLSRCATCHRNEFASDAEMRERAPVAVVAVAGPAAGGSLESSPTQGTHEEGSP
jgi:hypothetical protein